MNLWLSISVHIKIYIVIVCVIELCPRNPLCKYTWYRGIARCTNVNRCGDDKMKFPFLWSLYIKCSPFSLEWKLDGFLWCYWMPLDETLGDDNRCLVLGPLFWSHKSIFIWFPWLYFIIDNWKAFPSKIRCPKDKRDLK